ncbi:MAG: hypothetical protein FWC89_04560 [Defluviitaleaceae bacterium]|nr:hypothetical protein [Defluviitaleaceae bacterium]
MQSVRQIVDRSVLEEVITLPESFQCTQVELTIRPVQPKSKPQPFKKMTRQELMESFKGSRTEALTGII